MRRVRRISKLLGLGLICMTLQLGEMNVMANNAQELTNKELQLVSNSKYTATGDQAKLKDAVNEALNQGVTVNEVKDAMVQLYAYTGFPRSLNALNVLMNTVNERNDNGIATEEGKAASKIVLGADAMAEGTKTQTELVGGEVKGALFDFALASDQYLKSHLFGDIFASDVLNWREREIVTVAVLEALTDVDSQLNAHRGIAKHNGVTDAQLKEISNAVHDENSVSPFPAGVFNKDYAQYFSGKSWLAPLNDEEVGIHNVTFEPGSRNDWHVHHGAGQILVVVGGKGWYQEAGKPAQALAAGDVVYIAPEIKHWHGAAADSYFSHLAMTVKKEGVSVTWMEPVSDTEYKQLHWEHK